MKLANVSAYDLPGGAQIRSVSKKTSSWAVCSGFGSCLNTDGEWEHDPSPSNRDDDYIARTRHPSPEAAYELWLKFDGAAHTAADAQVAAAPVEEPAAPGAPKVYIVLAYRWGWVNNTHYIVKVLIDDLDGAIEAADEEAMNRGGKYGIVVLEFSAGDHRRVHYAPSAYREDREFTNPRIEIFRSLGQTVFFGATDGKTSLPDKTTLNENGEATRITYQDVDVPDWIVEETKRRMREHNFMFELEDDRNVRCKAGAPQRTKEEHDAWFKEVIRKVDAEVDQVFEKLKQKRAATSDAGGPVLLAGSDASDGGDGGGGGE